MVYIVRTVWHPYTLCLLGLYAKGAFTFSQYVGQVFVPEAYFLSNNVWIFSTKYGIKFIGDGPSMNEARKNPGCGIFNSEEHGGRPVIVVAGEYSTTSEYWDFTVLGSKWQLCSKSLLCS